MPKISVLMGAYNCAATIEKSVRSIQNQTLDDWELIICNDGSTDNTENVLRSLSKADERIKVISLKSNKGLSNALNECLKIASGEYCARMDGDDICDSSRFEKQVLFLNENPQYSFVSTTMKRFDEKGVYLIPSESRSYSPSTRDFVKGSPFCHAPVMIRRSAYDKVNGYRVADWVQGVEDYDLWFRLYAAGERGFVLSEPLYSMFDGRDAAGRRTFRRRLNEARVRRLGYRLLGIGLPYSLYCLKPLMIGLVPQSIYCALRRR